MATIIIVHECLSKKGDITKTFILREGVKKTDLSVNGRGWEVLLVRNKIVFF